MTIADRIKKIREIFGITSNEFAKITGIHPVSIRKYETNKMIPGNDVIEKGTDAGGSVEIYATVEDAENRCNYLSQFDETILYTGSYAVIGTMVIRTSYLLDFDDQVRVTSEITKVITGAAN